MIKAEVGSEKEKVVVGEGLNIHKLLKHKCSIKVFYLKMFMYFTGDGNTFSK